ncbi:MAG TPA: hypothetical protein PK255_00450 [Candidatus Pacearchaeota archaeon]|nr:hypothetical protein [Candidatus Pacearchaeota archaeon]HQI57488.1 hypothetical protein [Candidatus Pacearchaeota archaeon]HQJ57541.1 hypothetical protein [Candidatus Pacearchaeota archaeon]
MRITKETINFNKEILFGELGAIVGIQISGNLFYKLDISADLLSYLIVLGAMIGASLFWFAMRLYDKTRKQKYSEKNIIEDISYFAPGSFILTAIFYYPTLFFVSKYLIEKNKLIAYITTIPQIITFIVFLIAINIYRKMIMKYYNKEL